MAAPAAFINPLNPTKSFLGTGWNSATPPPAPVRRIDPLNPRTVINPGLALPSLAPGVGTPPPAPVYGQQRQQQGGGGGYQARFGPYQTAADAFNSGTQIDATPGDAPSPNANPGMGLIDTSFFAGSGGRGSTYEQREANAKPGAFGPPNSPLLAYGGDSPHTAIVGDPQADGLPNPEVVTSASPIHVVPMKGNGRALPHYAYGTTPPPAPLPSDLTRPDADSLELHADPRYTNPNSVNMSSGAGNLYTDPGDILRQQLDDAHSKGLITAQQKEGATGMLDSGTHPDQVRDLASQAFHYNQWEANQPSLPSTYAKAKADIAAAKSAPGGDAGTVQDQLPQDQSQDGGVVPPAGNVVPPASGGLTLGGGAPAQQPATAAAPPPAPIPMGQPAPPAAPPGVVPPAPQLGMIPAPAVDPMAAWNSARNPQREQTAINRFVRHNPLAMPNVDIAREANRVKANQEAQKFNREADQKHDALAETTRFHDLTQAHRERADTERERYHNLEMNAKDVAAKSKAKEDTAKFEAKQRELGDVHRTLEARAQEFAKDKDAMHELNLMMKDEEAATAKAALATFDKRHPREPQERTFGGKKGVLGEANTFHWVPQQAAPKGAKGKTASSYYE